MVLSASVVLVLVATCRHLTLHQLLVLHHAPPARDAGASGLVEVSIAMGELHPSVWKLGTRGGQALMLHQLLVLNQAPPARDAGASGLVEVSVALGELHPSVWKLETRGCRAPIPALPDRGLPCSDDNGVPNHLLHVPVFDFLLGNARPTLRVRQATHCTARQTDVPPLAG